MGDMAPPLAELTAHAQTLSSAGDLVAARAVLTDALDPVDTDPQRASPDIADAAALLARILIALGDPHGARLWAGFAHTAGDRLYGPHDERTVAAAALHAAVLHRIGNHGRAAQLYHELVGSLTALDGPDSPRVLAAEADLATAEHAAGHCTAARARLADAWARHRRLHGDAAPAGIKMLARLGAMERECGLTAESQEHLALVQELCARYLPADHPLALQAARLVSAPVSGRHICGRVERSTGPDTSPGVQSVHVPAGPGVRPVGTPPYREDQNPPEPVRQGRPPPSPPQAGMPAPIPKQREPEPPAPEPPEAPEPDNRVTDPKGKVYQQPLYLSDVHQAPGDLTGRHARADTPPPLPGQRAPEAGPDGRQIRIGAVEVPPPTKVAPPDRRLPVPLDEPGPRGSWQPLVLVAVIVAGIAVAAAVVVATLPHAGGGTPPAAARATTAAPASVPAAPPASPSASGVDAGTPPGNVRLRDNHDSVSLDWSYPKGAEGPVLISGARTGQELRAFQQLPAGTADYVVYGLNEQLDYCFTVAVVYTVDHVAASPQLCTKRR
jgi:hypothetical protein